MIQYKANKKDVTMDQKVLRTLEFDKIVNMLEEKAISSMGKAMAKDIKPLTSLIDIQRRQTETSEAATMLLQKGALPLGGLKDISASLKRASLGGALSIVELLHIGDFLHVVSNMKKYRQDEQKESFFPHIDPLFENLTPVSTLYKEIHQVIESELTIYDDASTTLKNIRRSIKSKEDAIQAQLQKILHGNQYKNMLQDSVITVRSGRYCLPVKQEYRSSFPGIIHDQSASGSTLFMEPSKVVDLNNQVKTLKIEEEEEIFRILATLTTSVHEYSDILLANQIVLEKLDFIFSRGKLSIDMEASEPIFNNENKIHIKRGRHPLLNKEKVVPIDIWLGDTFSTLLITGPNTGGKTVSLKTLGLLTLMGQAGLHIPALSSSTLTVFDNVFADIGDEQSIEQSLSTFSSHMTNIVSILENVTENSLVLLDELGAGTDPTEGAALAIAIIEYLFERGVHTVVTTHYSELKAFALSTDGIENAACEFDVETLQPTYKLLIGVPGKSNAFAISEKLGLPSFIIDMAKEALTQEEERFEDILIDLESSRQKVLQEEEKIEKLRKEAEDLKRAYENKAIELEKRQYTMIKTAKEEARDIVAVAKEEADTIIKDMLKTQSEHGKMAELEKNRMALSKQLKDINKELAPKRPTSTNAMQDANIGDDVFIHSIGQKGEVLTKPDNAGKLMVQAGIMRIQTNLADLSFIEEPEKEKKEASYTKRSITNRTKHIRKELDVRGMTVREALDATDQYLDDAFLARLEEVSIIHGKGTGALRDAISEHLTNHPYVIKHRLGEFGEGDSGVTVATLTKM